MARKASKKANKLPSNGAAYFHSIEDTEIVEYMRCKLTDAHILSTPSQERPSGGWTATAMKEEIYQGDIKVVDRDDLCFILLTDKVSGKVVAVFPLGGDEGVVERCIDSSRYFVVRVNNGPNRNSIKYIGIAFNERTAAFDFNVAVETSRREKQGLLQIDKAVPYDMETLLIKSQPKGEGTQMKNTVATLVGIAPSPTFNLSALPPLAQKKGLKLEPSKHDNGSTLNTKRTTRENNPEEAFEPFVVDFSLLDDMDGSVPKEEKYRCLLDGLICCV